MKTDPILNKAALLAKKKDYEGALKTLKDDEDRYHGSFKYYYLYGLLCLYSGSYIDALDSFNRARKIKLSDPSILLGFAVLYLKRMNTSQAISYYLEVLEKDKKNKIAKKALSVIRKHSTSDALSDWMAQGNIKKLFPPIPSPALSSKTIINTALITAAALALVCGILLITNILPNPFKSKNQRPSAEYVLSLNDKSESVRVDGVYKYIYTRDQIIDLYEKALSLFTSYRDEAAKINLNRIIESNASDGIKNRARLLIDNMEVPGFDTFKRIDNPSYSDVKNEPVLYNGVHVIWRGMATNAEVTEEKTAFDLLVGYDTRRTLEGIAPVSFNVPVSVNTERPLEVLGRIVLTSSFSEFFLEGVAIHQSGKLEE